MWTVTYTFLVAPARAQSIVDTIVGYESDNTQLTSSLQAGFQEQGVAPSTLLLSVRTVPPPTMLGVRGPVINSCGLDFCALGTRKSDSADTGICANALTCEQAHVLCCVPINPPKMEPPSGEHAQANGMLIAAGVCIIPTVCFCFVMLIRSFQNPVLFRMWPEKVQEYMHCFLSAKDDAAGFILARQTTEKVLDRARSRQSLTLKSPELEQNVVELLLYDLQGEWRLFDQDQMMPGIVTICEQGRTLYDDVHYPTQDLNARPGGVFRQDGWSIDMQRSDNDTLEWTKPGESGITWKRCKGISAFAIGDVVEWTAATTEQVTTGQTGEVVGFTDNRVRVEFEVSSAGLLSPMRGKKKAHIDCKPSALAVLESAHGLGQDEEMLIPAKALPSLAHCVDFKRLSLFADTIGKENTGLLQENEKLKRELDGRVDRLARSNTELSRENTRLRQQLVYAEDMRRELTNSLLSAKENTALSLENQRIQSRLSLAASLEAEITELSNAQLNAQQRITMQIQDIPPVAPAATANAPLGLRTSSRVSTISSESSIPQQVNSGTVRQRQPPVPLGLSPTNSSLPPNSRWANPNQERNWDFYAADDFSDDSDSSSGSDNLAI